MTQTPPSVLILGGGFAGLRVALQLSRKVRPEECTVVLIDRDLRHVNPAWLYEVATAFNPFEREGIGEVLHGSASVPFARILHGTGVVFLQRTVEHIDLATRTVRFSTGETLAATFLVLALGSQLATFGVSGVEQHAFSIKTIHEAIELRHHLVGQFLRYRSASRERQERAFRVLIVGGGLAGVELAGELVGFLSKLAGLHGVSPRVPRVVLVEASDTILREYPPRLRAVGLRRLRQLGVDIRTKTAACLVGPAQLTCRDDLLVPSDTVVWLSGVRTSDPLCRMGVEVDPRGGVFVEPTLVMKGAPGVFAAGDCVYAVDPKTGRIAPDVATAAIEQGTVVARNILRSLQGKPLTSYVPRPRPTLASVGGKFALAHFPPWQFSGRLGWCLKQLTDLHYLFSVLPNDVALRTWLRNVRVRIAND